MQRTMLGLIHVFIIGDFISNTNHTATRVLLCRLASFYYQGHVLDKYKKDGQFDFFHSNQFSLIESFE
jgi:hypothetical protein